MSARLAPEVRLAYSAAARRRPSSARPPSFRDSLVGAFDGAEFPENQDPALAGSDGGGPAAGAFGYGYGYGEEGGDEYPQQQQPRLEPDLAQRLEQVMARANGPPSPFCGAVSASSPWNRQASSVLRLLLFDCDMRALQNAEDI